MSDERIIHICIGITDNCQNLMESYGEICVQCNKCGRFDEDAEVGDIE